MFEFLIKIEDGSPVGNPISLENFKQTFNIKEVSKNIIKSNGYGEFINNEKPRNTTKTKVVNNGFILIGDRVYNDYQYVDKEESEISIDALKIENKSLIRSIFNSELSNSLTVDSVEYHAGFESAAKLKMVIDLAEAAGETEVTFFDVENVGHNLTINDAKLVLTAVYNDYQNKLAKKQSLLIDIDAANTIAEVEAVVWE